MGAALSYRHSVCLVILAGVCWSTMGLGIRLMDVANTWQILFYRSCAMIPFLLIVIALRSGGNPFPIIQSTGFAGVVGGAGLVLAFSGGIYSMQATSIANAMFLFAAAPFMTALIGWVLLREKVRHATIIATVVAMVGIAIMVWEGISVGQASGNIAALVSAFGFSVFTITLRWGNLRNMMPTVLLGGLFALLTAAVVCYTQDFTLLLPLNDILISLALGVFQVGLGLTLYTIGSRSIPAAELTLLSMAEVVLGPLLVWIVIGEVAGGYTFVGGTILMLAIAGNAVSGLRRKSTAKGYEAI